VSFLTGIRSLADLPIEGRRVLLRADLDVPLSGDEVGDDAAIRAALPTILAALERGAKVVVAAHLSRDAARRAPSLEPVGACISSLTGHDVHLPEDCIGDAPKKVVQDLRPGQICLLENLLFHGEEDDDDPSFAEKLAEFGDVYVNDALLASAAMHASVHALPRAMRERATGLLMEAELRALDRLVEQREKPYVAVVGGSSFDAKMALLNSLLAYADVICVGGVVANTLLAARGLELKASRVETDKLAQGRAFLDKALSRGVEIALPEDVVVTPSVAGSGKAVAVTEIPALASAFDVGPKTIARWSAKLESAKTVLVSGAIGVFEEPAFAAGTARLADALSRSPAYKVVLGGGAELRAFPISATAGILHVSSSGVASRNLLEGKRLPGIEALRSKASGRD
jgi:phosphoglycerate kinase